MKKMLSLVLSIVLVLSCFVTASAGIAPMTTEEITLTYASRGEDIELTKALAAQFEAKYPNIHVEILELDYGTYDTALTDMAATQTLPDVFWVGSVTDAINNRWVINLDEYYAADPDAADISPAILKYSQIGGKRFCFPAACKPTVTVLNKTLFEKYNVELPAYDWTLEDFKAIAEELAHPENYDFAVPSHMNFDEYLYVHYGYDGESYAFDDTWVAIQEMAMEWRVNKVSEMMTNEEKEAVLGSADASILHAGHTAMSLTAQEYGFWQLSGFLNGSAEETSGCEFLIYPLPSTELASDEAIVDYAVISSSCKYPREAWELGKWMTWNKEATILRNEWLFGQEELGWITAPMIMDEEAWNHTTQTAPEFLKALYENMEPVRPDIFPCAPNCIWMNVIWYFGDCIGQFERGETTPADYAPTLRQQGAEQYNGWTGWEVVNGTAAE